MSQEFVCRKCEHWWVEHSQKHQCPKCKAFDAMNAKAFAENKARKQRDDERRTKQSEHKQAEKERQFNRKIRDLEEKLERDGNSTNTDSALNVGDGDFENADTCGSPIESSNKSLIKKPKSTEMQEPSGIVLRVLYTTGTWAMTLLVCGPTSIVLPQLISGSKSPNMPSALLGIVGLPVVAAILVWRYYSKRDALIKGNAKALSTKEKVEERAA